MTLIPIAANGTPGAFGPVPSIDTAQAGRTPAESGQASDEDTKTKEVESLRQKRQSLQSQILLLESSADSAALSPEAIAQLKAQMEEVSAALKTAEGQKAGAPGGDAFVRRARFDSYEKGLPAESFGYYSLEPDEAEGYRVAFRPYANPAEEGPAESQEKRGSGTINTDQVDREIEQLEKERAALDQELAQAQRTEDGQAIQELKRRIAAADQELAAKDNDAYRKAHSAYTPGE